MRIFISYARVDKPVCQQIAEMLDIHQVWYDQRLYAGQHWWDEILRRLDWCDIFIYLLSPDAIESPYCQREYEIAVQSGKAILPVLIDETTALPESLIEIQYADMCSGMTRDTVKNLLNSIYLLERGRKQLIDDKFEEPARASSIVVAPPMLVNSAALPTTFMGKVADAMESGKFDDAIFLLKQAQERGDNYTFVNLDALLSQAEIGLQEQTSMKVIEREYRAISELVQRQKTRMIGCQSFASFRKSHANYDPDGLAAICSGSAAAQSFGTQLQTPRRQPAPDAPKKPPVTRKDSPVPQNAQAASLTRTRSQSSEPARPPAQKRNNWTLPMLEWREITAPSGGVQFMMALYPTTNIQFDTFIRDPKGYMNPEWWSFSPLARAWAEKNPRPRPSSFKGDKRPRESISWYEAMAFCQWLGHRLGRTITLPTQAQWRRAAQGDQCFQYPWGNTFDKEYCNTRESRIRTTTSVQRYPHGASPFGVLDMSGNTWEWCIDTAPNQFDDPNSVLGAHRALLGGSFTTSHQNAQSGFDFYLDPKYYYNTIGFRVITLLD